MADVILLSLGGIVSLIILIRVIMVVYQVRGSRPVIVELVPSNTEKSAKTVELKPYVEHICDQFPKTMGI